MNRIVSCLLSAMILMVGLNGVSHAQFGVGISVRIGPPPLPVYTQPLCPGDGYIWTPGYWAWDDDDGYYWVPGTWVLAPVGMLWTPGYWAWNDGLYAWNDGYWGPHIGFYGGINYGFGYTGDGFYGGYWQGDRFFYNRSVNNVNVTSITNVYNKTVINNNRTNVSFNGGSGGVHARPTPQQEAAARERHQAAIGPQVQHQQAARGNRQLFAAVNHGRPSVAATARPADFGHAVPARAAGGAYQPPKMSPREAVSNRSGSQNRTSGGATRSTNSPPSSSRSMNPAANSRPANSRSIDSSRSQSVTGRNSTRPGESRSTLPASRPSENRPTANRPGENQPATGSRAPASSRPAAPRPESAPARHSDRLASSSRPLNSPRRENAPAPRERSLPAPQEAPQPRRESPLPRSQASPPQREVGPPPHKNSPSSRDVAPKQEHKSPDHGR